MIQNTAVMTVSELNEYTRLLLAADPVIVRTSRGFLPEKENRKHTIRHETQPQG